MEKLRKTTKYLSQRSRCSGEGWIPVPVEFKSKVFRCNKNECISFFLNFTYNCIIYLLLLLFLLLLLLLLFLFLLLLLLLLLLATTLLRTEDTQIPLSNPKFFYVFNFCVSMHHYIWVY